VPDRTGSTAHAFEGARRDPHTVSLGRLLVQAPPWSFLPRRFSPQGFDSTRSQACFRDPTPARVSAATACFELVRPPATRLATRRGGRPRCVTTDFCFPLLRQRAPAPRALPASLRGLRLALGPWACTRGRETGGPGVSRRLIRFGGSRQVGTRRFSSEGSRTDRASDTPVASNLPQRAFRHAASGSDRQGRSSRYSVKMKRGKRPRMPSIDKGPTRTRGLATISCAVT